MHLDLYDDPWITVLKSDGTKCLMSTRDVIKNAHLISDMKVDGVATDIDNTAPFFFLSMLIVCGYRKAGKLYSKSNNYDKNYLLNDGCFNINYIDNYVNECRKAGITFNVFDCNRPFLQATNNVYLSNDKALLEKEKEKAVKSGKTFSKEYVPSLKKYVSAVSDLEPGMLSGNNRIFYSAGTTFHTSKPEYEYTMTGPQFAASLIRNGMFRVGSGRGKLSTGFCDTKPPIIVILKGDNLFETIAYSLPSKNKVPAGDKPIWEREHQPTPEEVANDIKNNDFGYLEASIYPVDWIRYYDLDENKKVVKSILTINSHYDIRAYRDNWLLTSTNIIAQREEKDGETRLKFASLDPAAMDKNNGYEPAWFSLFRFNEAIGSLEASAAMQSEEDLLGTDNSLKLDCTVYGLITKNKTNPEAVEETDDGIKLPVELLINPNATTALQKLITFSEDCKICLVRSLRKLDKISEKSTKKQPKDNPAIVDIVCQYSDEVVERITNEWMNRIAKNPKDGLLDSTEKVCEIAKKYFDRYYIHPRLILDKMDQKNELEKILWSRLKKVNNIEKKKEKKE